MGNEAVWHGARGNPRACPDDAERYATGRDAAGRHPAGLPRLMTSPGQSPVMTLRVALEDWTGLIAGVLATGTIFFPFLLGILPPTFENFRLLIGAGLVTGLFSRGTMIRGALTGAAVGFLEVIGIIMLLTSPLGPIGGTLLIPRVVPVTLFAAAIFVPSTTISGIIGILIRNLFMKVYVSPTTPNDDSPAPGWIQWAGIIAGSIVIVGSVFLITSFESLPNLLAPQLAAGFLAGFLSRGGIRAGFVSSLIAATLGIGILAVWILWNYSPDNAFAGGLAGFALAIVAIIAIPMAVIGGIIGAAVKMRLFGSGSR